MKSMIALIILVLAFSSYCYSQSPSEAVSARIAQKMKDSLTLTEGQRAQLYAVNIQLYAQKRSIWQQYSSDSTQVQIHLQVVENTRDSLYRPFLSEEQYQLYLQKKKNIVTNN
jgi:hypothetical protein